MRFIQHQFQGDFQQIQPQSGDQNIFHKAQNPGNYQEYQ